MLPTSSTNQTSNRSNLLTNYLISTLHLSKMSFSKKGRTNFMYLLVTSDRHVATKNACARLSASTRLLSRFYTSRWNVKNSLGFRRTRSGSSLEAFDLFGKAGLRSCLRDPSSHREKWATNKVPYTEPKESDVSLIAIIRDINCSIGSHTQRDFHDRHVVRSSNKTAAADRAPTKTSFTTENLMT